MGLGSARDAHKGRTRRFWSNRSAALLALGRAEDALVDAVTCRALKPGWNKAHFRVGNAHMALKRYTEASLAFYEGLRLDPENSELSDLFKKATRLAKQAHRSKAK